MAVTPELSPVTAAGEVAWVVVPLPSWPLVFRPQQRAAPVDVMPQVCGPPAATSRALAMFETVTGVDEDVVSPLPSRPLVPRPQQRRPPVTRAQVWSVPTEIESPPLEENPETGAGE